MSTWNIHRIHRLLGRVSSGLSRFNGEELTQIVNARRGVELDIFEDTGPQSLWENTVYLLRCLRLRRCYDKTALFEHWCGAYLTLFGLEEGKPSVAGRFARELLLGCVSRRILGCKAQAGVHACS
jgi:hypothetical protein